MAMQAMSSGPHEGAPVLQTGVPLDRARAVGILLHGRGARAENILELAQALRAQGVAWLAPQAAGNTWYPNRFIAPIASNEPWLSSALGQQVIVDNRVGASGAIGTRVAAAAEPDGHTLLVGSVTTMVTGPLLSRAVGRHHCSRVGRPLIGPVASDGLAIAVSATDT